MDVYGDPAAALVVTLGSLEVERLEAAGKTDMALLVSVLVQWTRKAYNLPEPLPAV